MTDDVGRGWHTGEVDLEDRASEMRDESHAGYTDSTCGYWGRKWRDGVTLCS